MLTKTADVFKCLATGRQTLESRRRQQDRLRGDDAGVAISLLAIARVFTEEHDYDRARERIREALPLAEACGLLNVVARLALAGRIQMHRGISIWANAESNSTQDC
jgi:hypothetical protein